MLTFLRARQTCFLVTKVHAFQTNTNMFNQKSTTDDVLSEFRVDLSSVTALVTGANTGLGFETVRALHSVGATVILAGRRLENVRHAAKVLGERAIPMQVDLSDLGSVEKFCKDFVRRFSKLHILVLNAGVMGIQKRETTVDGFEKQLGTNHFGHMLLSIRLLDILRKTAGCMGKAPIGLLSKPRVIVLTSYLHRRGEIDVDDLHFKKGRKYGPYVSYSQSKLANILFARELARKERSIAVACVHPGVVPTSILRHSGMFELIFKSVGSLVLKSVAQGSATSIYAALAPDVEAHSGAYYVDCARAQPSSKALDKELGKKLWDVSLRDIDRALKQRNLM